MNEGKQVTVELDVLSGRPNPSWSLTPPQRDELFRLLAQRTQESQSRWAAPGLGYRGLVLHIATDGGLQVLRVGGGTIDDGAMARSDTDRAVESYLLHTMPPALQKQFASTLPKAAR